MKFADTARLRASGRLRSWVPWLIIVGLVSGQHAFVIGARDLWWSDEVRHGGVLLDLLQNGDWLALKLNGTFYPDKPPIYFWYLSALSVLFGTTDAWVIFLGLALSVLACLGSAYVLARQVIGSRRIAFVSVVLLATGPYFLMLSHYARMDFLFAAAICLAWAAFHAGIWQGCDRRQIVRGFVWTAVAALTKGPVGILLPLLALVGAALWRRQPGLLLDRAVGVGLLVLVVVVGLWAGGIIAIAGPGYFGALLQSQIVDRALEQHTGGVGYLRYALTLPLVMAPWCLLVFFHAWRKVPAAESGTTYLTLCVVTGFLALSLIAEKHEYYLLPIMVPLSVLAAQVLLGLQGWALRRFWAITAAVMIAIGCVLLPAPWVVPVVDFDLQDMQQAVDLLWLPGLCLVAFGVLLFLLRDRPLRITLSAFAIGQSLAINGAVQLLAEPLNTALDPRHITRHLRPYVDRGYGVAIQHGIDGVFAYHLGGHYDEPHRSEAILAWLKTHPRAVIAFDDLDWVRISADVAPMEFVTCTRFAGETYIILAQPAPPDGAPLTSGDGCWNPVR